MTRAPSTVLRPDLCIVGAGKAGLAVAAGAAALGVPTVVVDERDLGEAMPRAGDVARSVLRDGAGRHLGLAAPRSVDWPALTARAVAAAESCAPSLGTGHLRAFGVTVLRGTASFSAPDTIDAGGVSIQPRRSVIATGAVLATPPLPGLDKVPWSGADRWTALETLPKSLLVLGAGRTGVEMAQIFARFGCRVTLVDGAAPLRGFDPELSALVLARLRREGVEIRTGRTVSRAEPDGAGLRLIIEGGDDVVRAEHLLLATGWRPAIEALRLDRARVRCEPGGIAVGPDGRTSNPKTFALGDVVGRGRSIEAAEAQAGVVLRAALFRQRAAFDPRAVPRILRTDPEIAVVGLTEAEARARHGAIEVWRWPYAETARARAAGDHGGHIKVLTTRSGRILGAGIVGQAASDLIGLWTLAVARGLTMRDIAALPLPADTYADLSRRVAVQAAFTGLNLPWVKRALKVVRWLG